MKQLIKFYGRAVSVIIAALTCAVGVTYAAVNTQATLLGTTIATTSADLLVWDGSSYSASAPGFTVNDLVPGTGSQEYLISFKNTGGSSLSIGAHIPTAIKFAGFNSTAATTAMKSVKVTLKNLKTGDKVDTTLYNLTLSTDVALPGTSLAGNTAGNPNIDATAGNYSIKFDIDAAGVGTTKATVDPFDITFTGKAVTT